MAVENKLNVREACDLASCSSATIYRLVTEGHIKGHKEGKRLMLTSSGPEIARAVRAHAPKSFGHVRDIQRKALEQGQRNGHANGDMHAHTPAPAPVAPALPALPAPSGWAELAAFKALPAEKRALLMELSAAPVEILQDLAVLGRQ